MIVIQYVVVAHALKDQASLFYARHDFNGIGQKHFGLVDQGFDIASGAEGVGAHNPHLIRLKLFEDIGKHLQGLQGQLYGCVCQGVVFLQAFGQSNLALLSVENLEAVIRALCQQHMKTVGAQINGCDTLLGVADRFGGRVSDIAHISPLAS